MFGKIKWWNNRKEVRAKRMQQQCINGRTWTRRITWLEDENGKIKFKMEDGNTYTETGIIFPDVADKVWQRFRDGMSIEDCVSIFGCKVKLSLKGSRQTDSPGDSHAVGGDI